MTPTDLITDATQLAESSQGEAYMVLHRKRAVSFTLNPTDRKLLVIF